MPETSLAPLAQIALPLPLDTLLLIFFLCLLAGYIIYSIILHYHWAQYSISRTATRITLTAYFLTTLPLLGVLGIISVTM